MVLKSFSSATGLLLYKRHEKVFNCSYCSSSSSSRLIASTDALNKGNLSPVRFKQTFKQTRLIYCRHDNSIFSTWRKCQLHKVFQILLVKGMIMLAMLLLFIYDFYFASCMGSFVKTMETTCHTFLVGPSQYCYDPSIELLDLLQLTLW